jgi:hypothetical protein
VSQIVTSLCYLCSLSARIVLLVLVNYLRFLWDDLILGKDSISVGENWCGTAAVKTFDCCLVECWAKNTMGGDEQGRLSPLSDRFNCWSMRLL